MQTWIKDIIWFPIMKVWKVKVNSLSYIMLLSNRKFTNRVRILRSNGERNILFEPQIFTKMLVKK